MSLNLDARQRAMLDEMHIPFWWPGPETAQTPGRPGVAPLAEARTVAAPVAPPAVAPLADPTAAPTAAAFTAPLSAPATPVRARPEAAPPRPAPAAEAGRGAAGAASDWCLRPALPLYASPAGAGGWLLVTEAVWPGDDPLGEAGGAAARLLDNMLRAMGLHRSPQVWLSALARPGADEAGGPIDWAGLLRAQQPRRVLLMGRNAARAALGSDEPLGRLRGRLHDWHGVPTVVTYDAPYLLRAQADKARAWADLCLALEG